MGRAGGRDGRRGWWRGYRSAMLSDRRAAARPRRGTWARRLVGAALVVGATLAGMTSGSPSAVHAARAPFVNVWIPYWDTSAGSDSYGNTAAASLQRAVSPFFFTAAADGSIQVVGSTSRLASTVNLARQRGLQVIPTVTDGAGKGGMAAIMTDDGHGAPSTSPTSWHSPAVTTASTWTTSSSPSPMAGRHGRAPCPMGALRRRAERCAARQRQAADRHHPAGVGRGRARSRATRRPTTGSTPRTRSSRTSTACG